MNIEQKHAILSKYIKTPQGRSMIASSMVQPLRKRRDYSSVIRKAFLVEQLPDGALPIYDKDPNITAYVVGEEGQNIIAVAKSKRIIVPLFELAANPEVQLTEIKARRFDLIQRSVDLATVEIGAEEDRKGFATMDAVASDPSAPNPDIAITGNVTATSLADAFAAIERNDIRVSNIFMNAKDFADFRKWDRDTLDMETQASLLKSGIIAKLWGANIIVSRIVPEGTVYVCGEPEFFGRIPVRTDLTILSADNPRQRTIGFSIFENLGIGVTNGLALQRCIVTR